MMLKTVNRINRINKINKINRSKTSKPRPPLKWPGGKTQLQSVISRHLPKSFNSYCEPFLGGGATYLELRSQGYSKPAFLADLNGELITTYQAIKDNPLDVYCAFNRHRACHCEEYFLELRKINWRELKPVGVAGRMIYLNRSCYNGLYRLNAKGKFNSSWGKKDSIRFDKNNLYSVSEALWSSKLLQSDYGGVLDYARSDDFCYMDPPYPNGFDGYTSVGFNESDHHRLHDICIQLDLKNVMFLQSNADCLFIRNLYKDFHIVPVQARRSINCKADGRGRVGELLIMNY